jgi:hypothetical protein
MKIDQIVRLAKANAAFGLVSIWSGLILYSEPFAHSLYAEKFAKSVELNIVSKRLLVEHRAFILKSRMAP